MVSIKWDKIEQPEFDRIVEQLIYQEYSIQEFDNVKCVAVDGRGGDGGIDYLVTKNNEKIIFQFKYYPTGFPRREASRRKSIKDSFNTALKQNPTKWILVVPRNLTRSEQEFLKRELRSDSVTVEHWGMNKLDSLLVKYPRVDELFNADPSLVKMLRYAQGAEAVPRNFESLESSNRYLRKNLDLVSPNWGVNINNFYSTTTVAFIPKHAMAQKVEPVYVDYKLKNSDSYEMAELKRMQEYGLNGSVKISHKNLEYSFFKGPADFKLLNNQISGIVFNFNQGKDSKIDGQLNLLDLHQNTSSYDLIYSEFNDGKSGKSFVGILNNVCKMRFYWKNSETKLINFEILDFNVDSSPSNQQRISRFLVSLLESREISLILEGRELFKASNNFQDEKEIENLKIIDEFATDLINIQNELNVYFEIQDEVRVWDRVWARILCLMLQGYMVQHPFKNELSIFIGEEYNQEELCREYRSVFTVNESTSHITLHGKNLNIKGFSFYSPSAKIIKLSSQKSSEGGGFPGKVVTQEGNFYIFLHGKARGSEYPKANWNIRGISESFN